jgi:hypothetical protein
MANWRELKAQGIQRCYIVFTNRRQCRARVKDQTLPSNHPEYGLCEHHLYVGHNMRAIHQAGEDAMAKQSRKTDWSEDE